MPEEEQAPPLFQPGQFVHLNTLLDPSGASTWVAAGELDEYGTASAAHAVNGIHASPEPVDEEAVDNNEVTGLVEPEAVDEAQMNETLQPAETAGDLQFGENPEQQPMYEPHPADLVQDPAYAASYCELGVGSLPWIPHLTTPVRYAVPWRVDAVLPRSGPGGEHVYRLAPLNPITTYASESQLVGAPVHVGSMVKKREDEDAGFWMVAGVSTRIGIVWADIVNGRGNLENIEAERLRMISIGECFRLLSA